MKADKRFTDKTFITIKEMLVKDDSTLNPRSGFSIPLECNINDGVYTVKTNAYEKIKRYRPQFSCELRQ